MSTTTLTAGEVMDRSAALMNDPEKTDYTYVAQLPYLNMAIDELCEELEESNVSPTSETSQIYKVGVGNNYIADLPYDLIEIQEVGERMAGSQDPFVRLGKREDHKLSPPSNSLLYWVWENQRIKFNPNGALSIREIQLKYIRQPIQQAKDEKSVIGVINVRSYLGYKTAALCAQFIGEDESRAGILNTQADKAIERVTGISNKGRQQMMTRHRPFRSSFKARGY